MASILLKAPVRLVVSATFALILTACGGGGGTPAAVTPPPANQSPTANAGPDQTVASGASVTLAGSGTDSDGTIASFGWTQTSGTAVTLSNAAAANPSFTAPTTATALALGFRLTITDNGGATNADDVVINVSAAAPPANQSPTANAGPDQTVASGASVTLAGSGTDSDGTIASFGWTQTSGTAVTLSNAAAANPSFTAPTTATALALGFRLTITDNGGATNADDVVINVSAAAPTTTSVSGKITYDRVRFKTASGQGLDLNNPVAQPARGVTVQALSTATPPTVLDSTQTNATGDYTLTVPQNTNMLVRVRVETKRSGTPSWDFTVVDNTNSGALYVLDSAGFGSGTSAQTRNLHAASGWDGSAYSGTRAAAPFAILDTLYDSFQKALAVDPNAVFAKLVTNWSINNVPSGRDLPAGMIGTSFYTDGNLYIVGKADVDTDEYDDHIIVHEWGHYFEDKLSRSDSVGGNHTVSDLLDLRVAFGEGFGNALSGIVTDDPAYRDSSGARQSSDFTINVETNPAAADNSGWYSEGSVQSILYDLYDGTADGSDNLQLGFGPLYKVFVGAQKTATLQTSIFTFITALKTENSASASAIDAIVGAQRINSAAIDDSGSQETNDAGNAADVLPIYTTISPNGSAISLSSINAFGEPNKLSNRRFLSFTLTTTANLTLTVTGGVDPDFTLNKRGQPSQTAATATAGSETLSAPGSTAGLYVLEVYDSANTDGNTATGGRAPLTVSVTAN